MAKNKFLIVVSLLLVVASTALGQTNKYLVLFNHKNGTPFTINNPQAYLSQRSIDRRVRQGINVDVTDLPVDPSYLNSIRQTGARVVYPLKWMNGAVVEATIPQLSSIEALPFVVSSNIRKLTLKRVGSTMPFDVLGQRKSAIASAQANYEYGNSFNQISMLGADTMHRLGFVGQGMQIAVMDAGYLLVDRHVAFNNLRNEGRLLGTYDFVNPTSNIYTEHHHGAAVLATMAAEANGQLIGTAPKASYYLFRTEDVASEREIECANWVAAIEKADSLGCDITNTSLGYTYFDDPSTSYTPQMMDGRTTFMSRMATMSARKGMLTVVSAGNDGNNVSWNRTISAPADADSILAVGALTAGGDRASFSSMGPSADGRIKPDVSAQGVGVVVSSTAVPTDYAMANGTSFAGPLIAGFAASCWQAAPQLTAMQLLDAIRNSGSISSTPNNEMGYGIPNFARFRALVGLEVKLNNNIVLAPSVVSAGEVIRVSGLDSPAAHEIIDLNGRLVQRGRITNSQIQTSGLSSGMYFVRITSAESKNAQQFKIVVR